MVPGPLKNNVTKNETIVIAAALSPTKQKPETKKALLLVIFVRFDFGASLGARATENKSILKALDVPVALALTKQKIQTEQKIPSKIPHTNEKRR